MSLSRAVLSSPHSPHPQPLQRSAVRLDLAAAALNAGQALILAAGMTGAMLAATAWGPSSAVTAGDLVMVQGLLLQLWAPLQFLVRSARSRLVD